MLRLKCTFASSLPCQGGDRGPRRVPCSAHPGLDAQASPGCPRGGCGCVLMASWPSSALDKIHCSCHGRLHLLVPRPGIIKILKGRAWEKADAD